MAQQLGALWRGCPRRPPRLTMREHSGTRKREVGEVADRRGDDIQRAGRVVLRAGAAAAAWQQQTGRSVVVTKSNG